MLVKLYEYGPGEILEGIRFELLFSKPYFKMTLNSCILFIINLIFII